MVDLGFVVLRHVRDAQTNAYWNRCVQCLRTWYPDCPVVVVDDHSCAEYVSADSAYDPAWVRVVSSKYPPGRGELLPWLYLAEEPDDVFDFDAAVVLHDSVFVHARIPFDRLASSVDVAPLWHFPPDQENAANTHRLADRLRDGADLRRRLAAPTASDARLLWSATPRATWTGCFGAQVFVRRTYVRQLHRKYGLDRLVDVLRCRADRCCWERLLGCMLAADTNSPPPSVFGNIFQYCAWGYTYAQYVEDGRLHRRVPPFVKVWTGR